MPILKSGNGARESQKQNGGERKCQAEECEINKNRMNQEVSSLLNYGSNERRVLVLYTGGTIGMVSNADGLLAPQKNVFEKLIRRYPQLHDNEAWQKRISDDSSFDKSFLILPKATNMKWRIIYKVNEYDVLLDSSNVSEKEWVIIAKDIEKHYEHYDGFVVLHGTDTSCYTASALSFMFENIGKAVVLTGAQIPIFEPRTDGVDNFVSSLFVAGGLNIPEVTVFFGNRLFRGNRCRKISADNFYAFHSPNCDPLVDVGVEFEVNTAAVFKPNLIKKFHVHTNLCRNVGLLRFFPSISTAVVKAFCAPPIEGIVLEAYGAGNLPINRKDVLDILEDAVKREVIMVIITQCHNGAVVALYETGQLLAKCGVVSGYDMTPEGALAKLSYVLSKTELNYEEKKQMMTKNLRGELTNMTSMELEDHTLKEALSSCLNIQDPKKLSKVTEKVITSLLLYGIEQDDLAAVKTVVGMGADVNAQSADGKTPIHDAILKGNVPIVEYLLKNGANVHMKRSSGELPLITAVHNDDRNVIELLLRCGAHFCVCDMRCVSDMFTVAVRNGSLRRVESLKAAGADLDAPDDLMQTPLHKAVLFDNPEIALYLIDNGADKDKRDIMNYTPLDYAKKLDRKELFGILNM